MHYIIHLYTVYLYISQDAYRGQVPLGLLVLNEPTPEHPTIDSDAVMRQAVDAVRHKIGAFAVFKKAVIVEKLPKTRSGRYCMLYICGVYMKVIVTATCIAYTCTIIFIICHHAVCIYFYYIYVAMYFICTRLLLITL